MSDISRAPADDDRIVTITVEGETYVNCLANAQLAEIGGRSSIRSRADRLVTLGEDQIVGQLAQCAGTMLLLGDDIEYRKQREVRNASPREGDGGYDILGLNVDFKGSLWRTTLPLMEHRLLVRPRERHPTWVYFLVMIERFEAKALGHFLGWATNEMLPNPETGGPFGGASVIPAKNLHRVPPFRWRDES